MVIRSRTGPSQRGRNPLSILTLNLVMLRSSLILAPALLLLGCNSGDTGSANAQDAQAILEVAPGGHWRRAKRSHSCIPRLPGSGCRSSPEPAASQTPD